jgi:ABC-type sugar transport system substrate-binding protein
MRLALLVAITLLASACASADQPSAPVGVTGVDEAQMQAVEQAAERNGVRVYWMNPPRKPSASTDK